MTLAIDGSWVFSWEADEEGRFRQIHPAWRELTGQSFDAALGQGWLDVIHADDREQVSGALKRAIRQRTPLRTNCRLRQRNGVYCATLMVATPRISDAGAFLGHAGTIAPLAAPAVESNLEALTASEERYRSLFETSRDGIVTVDMAGRIIEANPAYQTMLGYTLAELKGLTYRQLTPGIWHEAEAAIIQRQVLPHGESAEYEKEYIRKDGTVFPISLRTWTVLDADRRVVGMRAFVRDITERKDAEAVLAQRDRALRHSELRHRTLVNAASAITWSCPPSGRQVEPQPEWMAFTGQSAEEMMGHGWANAIHPDDVAGVTARWAEAMARAEVFSHEHRIRRHDGQWRWMSAQAAPIRDANGAIVEWFGMNIDITERKQAEAALRASEQTLLDAQRSARAGVWHVDLVTHQVTWSAPFYELYGLPRSVRPSTENWLAAVHPDDRQHVEAEYARSLAARDRQRIEFRIFHNGQVRWLHSEGRVICNDANAPVRITGITWDITDRKKTEEALRETQERYELVVKGSEAAIWDWDVPNRRVTYSPCWKALRGLSDADVSDREEEWSARIHAEDVDRVMAAIQDHFAGRAAFFAAEYRVRHKDGRWIWIQDRGAALRDVSGQILRMAGSETDITERKAAEAALRESEERFRACFANASIGFAMAAPDCRIVDANPAYCAITGYTLEELCGRPIEQLIHPDDRAANMALIDAMIAGETTDFVVENRFIRKDGDSIWVRKSISVVREDQTPRWLVALVEDITARVRAEEAMRGVARRKDEFIATLAHELRNPLTPIHNAVHILKRKRRPEDDDAALFDMIERQTAHLVRLVNDLLEISRISAGKIDLRKQRVDMMTVLCDALETCRPLIDEKGHLVETVTRDTPLSVYGDPVRLVQIAANLINNAAKYTLPGGVLHISVERDGAVAALRVRDTGVGIDPSIMPQLFSLFSQAGNQHLSEGGLGIGLALSRKLVELHGGSIEGRSEGVGKGSEFIVRLPLDDEAAPKPQTADASVTP